MSEFSLLSSRPLPALKASVHHFRHAASGCEHIHLATEEAEMGFLVAFPTVPMSSDGRAHILEHMVLCGSRRYPVADPFFMMMRRSVATFMNAMTYADRTVYPFSTTDQADYANLLDVFLDATFFPNLDRLSFLQEGWREVLTDGQLAFQGVVLNEMKGNYSQPGMAARMGVSAALYTGTTYAVNSGGDPLEIPALSHQDLCEFHRTHYHPSQAVFMTSGPVDPVWLQSRLADRVLQDITTPTPRRRPQKATLWSAPRALTVDVPTQGDGLHEHAVQLSWLLGDAADRALELGLKLVTGLLVGSAGAPLTLAMETAGYGYPGDLTGLDMNSRQIALHLSMKGLTEAQLAPARQLLTDTLARVATDGLPMEMVVAGLRDLRFRERQEVGGLQRLLSAVGQVLHGEDPLTLFDSTDAIDELSRQAQAPDFVQRQLQFILQQPTHLVTHLRPSAEYFDKRRHQEQQETDRRLAELDEVARRRIAQDEQALLQRQQSPVDEGLLPRICPQDLSREPRHLTRETDPNANVALATAANGLSHLVLAANLDRMADADWPWLSLYADLVSRMGAAGRNAADAANWRQQQVPAFSMGVFPRTCVNGQAHLEFVVSASSLREDQLQMPAVIQAWLLDPNLEDTDRLSQLLRSTVQAQCASLSHRAEDWATMTLLDRISTSHPFQAAVDGPASLNFLAKLKAGLSRPEGLADVVVHLQRIRDQIRQAPRQILTIAQPGDAERLLQDIEQSLPASVQQVRADAPSAKDHGRDAPLALAVHAPAAVNACLAGWRVPGLGHADAPALAVAAELLSHRMLHPKVREQGGAYGASAVYLPRQNAFLMRSSSDPRLLGTYADFEASLDEMTHRSFDAVALEEAIVSVIKRLDPPMTSSTEAITGWQLTRAGVTHELRQAYRYGVLDCTLAQVRQVCARRLPWAEVHRAAAAGNLTQDLTGLALLDIPRLCLEHRLSEG